MELNVLSIVAWIQLFSDEGGSVSSSNKPKYPVSHSQSNWTWQAVLQTELAEEVSLQQGQRFGMTVSVSQSGKYKCFPARVTVPLLTCLTSRKN